MRIPQHTFAFKTIGHRESCTFTSPYQQLFQLIFLFRPTFMTSNLMTGTPAKDLEQMFCMPNHVMLLAVSLQLKTELMIQYTRKGRRGGWSGADLPSRRRKETPPGCSTSVSTSSSRLFSWANTSTLCPAPRVSRGPSAPLVDPPTGLSSDSCLPIPHSCSTRPAGNTLAAGCVHVHHLCLSLRCLLVRS